MENNQNQEAVTQTEEKTEAPATQAEEKNETKTFTQEEVNAMILKETNKINKKYEGVDLKKYKEWADSQKTETEKQNELAKNLTNTTNENISLKQEIEVLKSGVQADDADYVLFKVSKMEGEFEDNLKSFLKDNPKYLQKEAVVETPQNTGVSVTKINNSEEDGVIALLKAKHPDAFN